MPEPEKDDTRGTDGAIGIHRWDDREARRGLSVTISLSLSGM